MTVTLARIVADDQRLARLMQLYIHEWSALIPVPIGDDALFRYDFLELARDHEKRIPFLFCAPPGSAPVGFGLVMHETGVSTVEEFFVIAGARRRGVGLAATQSLFATHPGPWTFTVRSENPSALSFWRQVAPGADEQVELGADGIVRTRFRFTVR
jgi:predicted acetyltransferase